MPPHTEPVLRIRYQDETRHGARIKVVGAGGAGNNAVNRMIDSGLEGVEFISMNTDLQSLQNSKAGVRLQLGTRLTRGLGTGANPEIGRRAALEDSEKIIEALEDADMVFVTAGLGGGTGTGAAPVIASLASQMGALTVAIVTWPFAFEGKRRMNQAERGIQELLDHADTLIVIPNDKLLTAATNAGFFESFQIADDVLRQAVQGIAEIVTSHGVINRDFADIRTTMAGMGYAVMGSATRMGPNRAAEAALAAMTSPLLESGAIDGARGILINITGSSSLKLSEVSEASTLIQNAAHEDANIIFGATLDERLGDEIKVTVIAAGFREDSRDRAERRSQMLHEAAQPGIYPENRARVESYGSIHASDVAAEPQPPVRESIEPETELALEAALPEADDDRISSSEPVEEFQQSDSLPPLPLEQQPNYYPGELVEADSVHEWLEEDLLAKIEGPVFDFEIATAEPEEVPRREPAVQPEIAKLRQTAVAAYTASSMIEVEDEEPAIPREASFAEILARRAAIQAPVTSKGEAEDMVDDSARSEEMDIPTFLRRRS